jgi:hypothetical protein
MLPRLAEHPAIVISEGLALFGRTISHAESFGYSQQFLFDSDNSHALAGALVSRMCYDTLNRGAAGVGD